MSTYVEINREVSQVDILATSSSEKPFEFSLHTGSESVVPAVIFPGSTLRDGDLNLPASGERPAPQRHMVVLNLAQRCLRDGPTIVRADMDLQRAREGRWKDQADAPLTPG